MSTLISIESRGMVSDVWSWWWWWCCWENTQNDDYLKVILMLVALVVISWCTWVFMLSRREAVSLPPGPWALPIVGNLPFLNPDLHRCFADLARTHGPIMKLRLGRKLCIVVSSPLLAKEVMKDHDIIFANHDVPVSGFISSYGGVDMAWSPYGAHWRMLRKVCVTEMLNNRRLDSLSGLRRREVRDMVSQVYSKIGTSIDIGELILVTILNVMTSMLWGDDSLKGEERNRVTAEFQQVAEKVTGLLGETNISDLFPAIAWFDIQGVGRRMKKALLWFDGIFDSVIDQRLQQQKSNSKESMDLLQVLLQLKEKGDPKMPLTMTHIKALFMDMVVGGTKTTSTTMKWALAELLKQPQIMRKLQEELEETVGLTNMVEESHLPKLHYLHAVVKEVLCLHPATPLLVPRSSSAACTVGGFKIPKGTKVVVNAWAIQRDPMFWENPLEFQPERFLGADSKFDYSGTDFRYIPFGSGRRICVGIPMAERMALYLLAVFLHSFEWKLPGGTKLDMSEKFGLELKKATPLIAIPTPRLSEQTLYT